MKNFRLTKFIPYGSNETIQECETFHEAHKLMPKHILTRDEYEKDCAVFIEGKINGEWYALA